jgi:glycosidase
MGVDGFRCDMAEMVPVEFWGWVIPQIKEKNPEIIFIAEIYNPVSYRNYIYHGKFDYLYDKVGLYDTLRSVACNKTSASNLTGCWQNVTDIQDHMLNFLENHDEQRIGSNYFLGSGLKAKAAMTVSATLFKNPVMIYFGQELGERGMDNEGFSGIDGRTTIFDYWTVDTIRRWRNKGKFDGALLKPSEIELRGFYKKLLTLCNQEPAIREGEMFDLMYVNYGGWMLNDQRHYAYLRKKDDNVLLIVANFSNSDARIGVKIPEHAFKYLNMKCKADAPGVELLTGAQGVYQFLPEKICTADVKAYDSVIIKLNLL